MTELKLMKVFNKMDTILFNNLSKIKKQNIICFEELTDIRNQFIEDCLTIYNREFEKEFIENINDENIALFNKIKSYVAYEIHRLAYRKKWSLE